jgi:hypothetical protein
MSDLTPEQSASRVESLQRSLDEPMPDPLRGQLEDLIEPHTINMYLDHGDVMTCIDVAFPVIRDYLRERVIALADTLDEHPTAAWAADELADLIRAAARSEDKP